MSLVMDASALTALLKREPGAELVRDCLAHAINLCEIYYVVRRLDGAHAAEQALADVEPLGIVARHDLDAELWKQVGAYKADLGGLSLADCFCLALATRVNGEIVTSDHGFDKVVERNLCPVRFIR